MRASHVTAPRAPAMPRSRRTAPAVAVIVVSASLALALAGCSVLPATPWSGSPLEGVDWDLVGSSVSSVDMRAANITARFDAGTVSGHSGVNSYSGPYRAGPGDAVSIGPLAGTTMAVRNRSMRAEQAYLALLGAARHYRVEAGVLTLSDEGGNESLVFRARD